MSDLRFQLRALADSKSIQYGIASSVVAAAGALVRPVRRSEAGRLACRTGFAAYTAWELSAWPRDDWQTPSVDNADQDYDDLPEDAGKQVMPWKEPDAAHRRKC